MAVLVVILHNFHFPPYLWKLPTCQTYSKVEKPLIEEQQSNFHKAVSESKEVS